MKDQYFGDLSDYKKYSLLRALSVRGGLKTSVCWMLTPDDGGTDGKHTAYLADPAAWRRFDPPVFDLLVESVVNRNERAVRVVEMSDLLPDVSFHSELLTDDIAQRHRYFADLHKSLLGADLVFLDPDNGLEVKSTALGRRNSGKYLYWHELDHLYRDGRSVLVYQHYTRSDRAEFVRRIALAMLERYSCGVIYVVRTRHTAFFLISQEQHRKAAEAALVAVSDTWGEHISCYSHSLVQVLPLHRPRQFELL